MKKYFFSLIIFFSFFSLSFADYKLEPTNCTAKKKDNCGAYLYNIKTGSTFFCTSDKCTEILEALEGEVEVEATGKKESKKSKIPKFGQKKEKKKSKIPKFKKSD